MKRILITLILALMMGSTAKASHVYGGEITWKCLNNGKYIFFMSIYRDCTGAGWNYNNASLEIFGNPKPRGANNSTISSILLKPDSNKWTTNRNGDTSPQCDPSSPNDNLSCASGDPGTVQAYYYKSDPLTLKGTPPVTGWRFVFTPPCCRPSLDNLSTGGTPIYRAIMYPDVNGSNVDPCIDSSPEFKGLPASLICRYYTFTYNNTTFDEDLDSVVYAWDKSYNTPASSPSPISYQNGYAFNNPTPDKSFNNQNIPSTLDPITGVIKLAVYSGGPQPRKYLTVVRADSYRDGVVIASVFREIPFVLFDCPPLPKGPGGVGGGQNSPPDIFIDGVAAEDTIADIIAGQTVSIPFQATDYDYGGPGQGGLQKVTTVPDGFMFSTDLISKNTCYTPSVAPCAILQNQTPVLNTQISPPRREISAYGGIATEFRWDTRCYHIRTIGTGVPGQQFGIYSFVMRTLDDHCPIPGINYPTITVRVRDPFPLTEPIMKGVSVNLDGSITYQWAPPIDTAFTFNRYQSEFSTVNDNQPPAGAWQTLNPNIRNYKQSRNNTAFPVYSTGPGGQDNILDKIPGKDWYFRMLTESGCSGNDSSAYSDAVRIIEVEASPAGVNPEPARARAKLEWNRPTKQFPKTYPYYIYESNTHYYIWENDSIVSFGNYIGGEAKESNWYLRGDTSALTYTVKTNNCDADVGFRIEARDTLITWRQGSGPGTDSTDTLTFSTFSTIDTMLMVDQGYVNAPQFDSIIVMPNGDVYFRIDRVNAGPVSQFRIYDESTTPPTKIADFSSEVDSFLYTGINANNSSGKFKVGSVDECDPTRTAKSDLYNTILPTGKLLEPKCAATFGIKWNIPGGFTSDIDRFEIYVDSANTGFKLKRIVKNKNADSTGITGIQANTDYKFKVVAIDKTGAYNASAILLYTSPQTLRTFEIVPAPEIQCTYVNDDGTVSLTFSEPRDSSSNGVSYEFDYRQEGGSWQTFSGSNAVVYGVDTTVDITGIDAQTAKYEFRSRTISGCDGKTPSKDDSPVVSSIMLTASADYNDKDKPVVVSWNDNQVSNKQGNYDIFRALGTPSLNPYFAASLFDSTQTEGYIDLKNGTICDTINGYYVDIQSEYNNGRSTCMNRSSYDTANVKDVHPPSTQLIDFITVNPSTEMLEIYWSNQADQDIDSIYFYHNIGEARSNNLNLIGKAYWYKTPQMITIPINTLDVRDSSFFVTAQAVDGCGNVDDDYMSFDYHRNMDLKVVWNQCDSTLSLDWNSYSYFNEGVENVSYSIYLDSTNSGSFTKITNNPIQDTSYEHQVFQGDLRYRFYVKAINDVNTFTSNSNIGSDSAFYQDEPLYGYLHYATVLENKAVEVQMLKDTVIRQGGYKIFRGKIGDLRQMRQIHKVDGNEVYQDNTFAYEDAGANTSSSSYFYKIVTENLCGGDVDTTNFARSIYLSVSPDNEALTNTLKWNEYTEWDSTVAFYNIYRGFNGGDPDELIATVAPSGKTYNSYVDDVYEHTLVKGRYCYKVEAVQGPIDNLYRPMISSATSMSNEACATQKPLIYVPNAFAPDGVNKVFRPKGQFFDFAMYELVIYNRWGEKIFTSRDINEGWDGTHNGEIVPLGSYVYTIRLKDADGKTHKRKGTVTVIR